MKTDGEAVCQSRAASYTTSRRGQVCLLSSSAWDFGLIDVNA
jgi:hypothetical protein